MNMCKYQNIEGRRWYNYEGSSYLIHKRLFQLRNNFVCEESLAVVLEGGGEKTKDDRHHLTRPDRCLLVVCVSKVSHSVLCSKQTKFVAQRASEPYH